MNTILIILNSNIFNMFSQDIISYVQPTVTLLNNEDVINKSTFLAGVLWNVQFKQLMNTPLQTMLGNIIDGCISTVGSNIVLWFVPNNYKFIIHFILWLSLFKKYATTPIRKVLVYVYYWIMNKLKGSKQE